MTADEIRDQIMTMEFTDPRAVADALQHIAEHLVDIEHHLEVLDYGKQDVPYKSKERF